MQIDIVVAHADDEIFFAGGFLQKFDDVKVIVLTQPEGQRELEFKLVCQKMGWQGVSLGAKDIDHKRLPIDLLENDLKKELRGGLVVTHNPLGEYGHWHHQDAYRLVSKLVNQFFVFGFNMETDFEVKLTLDEAATKANILEQYYSSQKELFGEVDGAWRMLFDRETFALVTSCKKKKLDLMVKMLARPAELDEDFCDLWGYTTSDYEIRRLENLKKMLRKIPKESHVLEVGPCEGVLTEFLSGYFDKVTVAETDKLLHERMVEKYGKDQKVTIINADGFQESLGDKYDAVIFSSVLVYASDDDWEKLSGVSGRNLFVCEGRKVASIAKDVFKKARFNVREITYVNGAVEQARVRDNDGNIIDIGCLVRKEPVDILHLSRP